MPADGTKNLSDIRERATEEQQNFHKQGGIASGISRKKKATIKSLIDEGLQRPITSEAIKAKFEQQGYSDELMITALMVATKTIQLAIEGDLEAIKYINELQGDSPMLQIKKEEIKLKKEEIKIRKIEAETKRLLVEKGTDDGDESNEIILNLNL